MSADNLSQPLKLRAQVLGAATGIERDMNPAYLIDLNDSCRRAGVYAHFRGDAVPCLKAAAIHPATLPRD